MSKKRKGPIKYDFIDTNVDRSKLAMIIAKRIKFYKEAFGLDQIDVANIMGYSVGGGMMTSIEKGRTLVPLDRLQRLATAIKVPLIYFLIEDEGLMDDQNLERVSNFAQVIGSGESDEITKTIDKLLKIKADEIRNKNKIKKQK